MRGSAYSFTKDENELKGHVFLFEEQVSIFNKRNRKEALSVEVFCFV